MPPLCLHLSIVKEAAELLQNPILDQNMGGYAFGATLPDVHIITGLDREETHFFDLSKEDYKSGTKTIFEAHPHLAQVEKLDGATKSVVAGYLSHLITDEIWIVDIYRPFFGNSSPLRENAMANMFDKLIQYELDRREREGRAAMEEIRSCVIGWEPGDDIDFIDRHALIEWRDFVCAAAIREPNLALFPFFAKRFLLPRLEVDPTQLEQFFSSLHANLEWVIQYVTPERLAAFREKTVSQSVGLAREYLGEDC